jgi:hypothetical protein
VVRLVGGREREDEARADRLDVEGDAAIDAERGSGSASRRRERLSGVEVATMIRSISEASCRHWRAQPAPPSPRYRGRLVIGRDMALADAGALDDPLVGRVDTLPARRW